MYDRARIPARAAAVILLFLLIPLPGRGAAVPRTEVRLEPAEVCLGETAVLTVSASWSGDGSELVFSRPSPPDCRGLTVVGSSQRSVVAYREKGSPRQVREFLFRLRGDEAGRAQVGPVRLSYRERGAEEERIVSTEPLEVPVILRDSSSSLPLPAVIGAVLAAGLAALYVRWMVRRYQKKSNEIISDYVENLESSARRELQGARRYRLEGEAEQYCQKMRSVLLDYLEKRSGLEDAAGVPADDGGQWEARLEEALRNLDEYRFGRNREETGKLDDIYRRIDVIFRELEKVSGGREAETGA